MADPLPRTCHRQDGSPKVRYHADVMPNEPRSSPATVISYWPIAARRAEGGTAGTSYLGQSSAGWGCALMSPGMVSETSSGVSRAGAPRRRDTCALVSCASGTMVARLVMSDPETERAVQGYLDDYRAETGDDTSYLTTDDDTEHWGLVGDDGALLGVAVGVSYRRHGWMLLWGYVHPEHRRKGLMSGFLAERFVGCAKAGERSDWRIALPLSDGDACAGASDRRGSCGRRTSTCPTCSRPTPNVQVTRSMQRHGGDCHSMSASRRS